MNSSPLIGQLLSGFKASHGPHWSPLLLAIKSKVCTFYVEGLFPYRNNHPVSTALLGIRPGPLFWVHVYIKLCLFTCCTLTESQLALWTELNSVIRLGERFQSPIIRVNDWGGYVLHRKRHIYLHTTTAELGKRIFLQLTSGETAPLCWEGPSNGIPKRSVLISCLQST